MVEPDFANSLINSLKCVDWEDYYKDSAGLRKGELSVRSLEKKYYYDPDFESQDVKSETDLLKVVSDAIAELKHCVEDKRWTQAFWDDEREIEVNGTKIKIPASPKMETKIQPTLGIFFEHRLNRLGIHVSRETDEGIGYLDFKFMITTENRIPLLICAEFKLAHNKKLEHGITKQLPSYLRSNSSTSGIFFVMWFKDEEEKYFDKPTNQNKVQMIEFIEDKIKIIGCNEKVNIELL